MSKESTMEPCLKATSSVWPPCCFNDLTLAQTKAQLVIFVFKEPLNSAISLKRLNFCASLVTMY